MKRSDIKNSNTLLLDCRFLSNSGLGLVSKEHITNIIDKSRQTLIFLGNPETIHKELYFNSSTNVLILKSDSQIFSVRTFFTLALFRIKSAFDKNNKIRWIWFHYDIPFFAPRNSVAWVHDIFHASKFARYISPKRLVLTLQMFSIKFQGIRIATGSATSKDELISKYNFKPELLNVFYHGYDHSLVKDVPKQSFKKPRPYFVCVGNIKPHKNFSIVLDAIHRLKNPAFNVLFIGRFDHLRGQDKLFLSKITQSQNCLHFSNADDQQVYSSIRQSIGLISPSIYEGFGLPPLEAIANGVPVLCSDIPVYRELYSGSAQFFNNQNPEELAALMLSMTQSTEPRPMLPRHFKPWRHVTQHFCVEYGLLD